MCVDASAFSTAFCEETKSLKARKFNAYYIEKLCQFVHTSARPAVAAAAAAVAAVVAAAALSL